MVLVLRSRIRIFSGSDQEYLSTVIHFESKLLLNNVNAIQQDVL